MLAMRYFHVGVINGWVGPALLLAGQLCVLIAFPSLKRRLKDVSWYKRKEKVLSFLAMAFWLVFVSISFCKPLLVGTVWFVGGGFLFLLSFVALLLSVYCYAKAPLDEPADRGIYRITRNPIYLFYALALVGVCLATKSLLLFIVLFCFSLPVHFLIIEEESFCLRKYGELYWEYMNEVPRYL